MKRYNLKKLFFAKSMILLLSAAAACSQSKPEMKSFNLTDAGVPASVMAPADAAVKKGMLGAEITSGKQFALLVHTMGIDLAKEKINCEEAAQKNCEVEKSDGSLFIAKWKQLGRTNYQLFVQTGAYSCQTDPLSSIQEKTSVDWMVEACQSLKAN